MVNFQCTLAVCCACRAPVLVALALIELGLKYEDAVDLIRQCVLRHRVVLDRRSLKVFFVNFTSTTCSFRNSCTCVCIQVHVHH